MRFFGTSVYGSAFLFQGLVCRDFCVQGLSLRFKAFCFRLFSSRFRVNFLSGFKVATPANIYPSPCDSQSIKSIPDTFYDPSIKECASNHIRDAAAM